MEIDVMEHLTPSKMEERGRDKLYVETVVEKREEKGLSEIEEEFLTHKAKRLREIQTLLDNAKKELHEIINSIKREA
jgi:hypothetical protein